MPERLHIHAFFSDLWIIILLRGLAALLLGVLLLFQPLMTLTVLVAFLGFYWLVNGIMTVVAAIRGREHAGGWGWILILGVISAVAGFFVLSAPVVSAVFTVTFLVYLLAFAAIMSGVSEIVTGIRLRKQIEGELALIVGGILWLVLGVCLLGSPLFAASLLVYTVSFLAIIGGVVLLFLAFKARGIAKSVA